MLGIDRVVTMAGCPGGRTGGPIGVFGLWSISNDDEAIWAWQMEAEVGPYWRGAVRLDGGDGARRAGSASSCTRACRVWSAGDVPRSADVRGANIGVNLDPSHFWWQGADPIRVIGELGRP